jgi:hypothetical protein
MSGTYTNIVQGGASITIGSDLGYIQGGVTLITNADMYYATVEGINTDLHARNTKQTYEIRTTLVEPTMANLKIALDWSTASATASGGNINKFGGGNFKPTERDVVIYGYVPGSGMYARNIEIYRGGEITMANAEETRIPIVIHGLYTPSASAVGCLTDAIA